jgi:DNA-binding PadR family transcriptional regulator
MELPDLPELAPSAYVTLGLLEVYGPGTPYDLKRWADGSIGYFWSVPRAQLYVEPTRLAKIGLLEETQELEGRRRRVYRITDSGRVALRAWLRAGSPGAAENRDPGLLKLYFSAISSQEEVVALARKEAEIHAVRLAEYEAIQRRLEQLPRAGFALATLRLGQAHERAAVDFWTWVAEKPPSVPEPGAPLAAGCDPPAS